MRDVLQEIGDDTRHPSRADENSASQAEVRSGHQAKNTAPRSGLERSDFVQWVNRDQATIVTSPVSPESGCDKRTNVDFGKRRAGFAIPSRRRDLGFTLSRFAPKQ
jgi:hypothetical protein